MLKMVVFSLRLGENSRKSAQKIFDLKSDFLYKKYQKLEKNDAAKINSISSSQLSKSGNMFFRSELGVMIQQL